MCYRITSPEILLSLLEHCSFETMLLKNTFGCMQRLKIANTLICTLYKSWIARFKIQNDWMDSVYGQV